MVTVHGVRSVMTVGSVLALLALTSCYPTGYSITVDGTQRTYQLYLPPPDSSKPIPLVVALHPLLLTGWQMRQLTGFDEIAEQEGFAVAYPDGIGRRWDVTSGSGRDVRFIAALIDELVRERNIDPARVYAAGASNGAMLCHQLACRIPERLAGIAAVIGTPSRRVFDECQCAKPMPVMIIHGTADPIVPYEGEPGQFSLASVAATAEFWAVRNGCDGKPSVTPMPDTDPNDGTTVDTVQYACANTAPVILYRVNGGGHAWPGSPANFPEWVVGRISFEINAGALIWEFFETKTATAKAE